MPYVSEAQRGYFHAHKKELEAQGVNVGEWDRASKGKKLPKRKSEKTKRACAVHKIACWVLPADPGQGLPACHSQPLAQGGWFRKLAELAAASGLSGGDSQQLAGNCTTRESCAASGQPSVLADMRFDAVRNKIASLHRGRWAFGPLRQALHANRQTIKQGFVDRAARGAVAGSPATAWQNLMQLVQPTPKPNVPTAQGLNLQPMTPGGEMGGRNTPSTNPIGLMSGLGVDPGGSSAMGNAAFGTRNNSIKSASEAGQASRIRSLLAGVLRLGRGQEYKASAAGIAIGPRGSSRTPSLPAGVPGSLPRPATIKQAYGPYDRLPGQAVSRNSQYYASRRADAMRSAARRAGTPMGIGQAQQLSRGVGGTQFPAADYQSQMSRLRQPAPSGKRVTIGRYHLTPEQVQNWSGFTPEQRQTFATGVRAQAGGAAGQMTPYGFAHEGNRIASNPAWSYLSSLDTGNTAAPQRVPGPAVGAPSLAARPSTAPAGTPARPPSPPAVAAARQQPAAPRISGPGAVSSLWRVLPWNRRPQPALAGGNQPPTAPSGQVAGPVLRAPANASRPQIPASIAEAMAGRGGRRPTAPGLRPPRAAVPTTLRGAMGRPGGLPASVAASTAGQAPASPRPQAAVPTTLRGAVARRGPQPAGLMGG